MRAARLGLLLGALSLFALPVSAQAPLLNTFGGTMGFGTGGVLPGNDDGSSAMLDLTAAFPGGVRFFGGPYTTFWVNNNGNITFNGPVYNYTPIAFPIAAQPMIAPYWGDVDTRGGGTPGRNYVAWHLAPGLLVVTWYNVGYFNTHDDHQMSFQLILRNSLDCGSGNFDVEFRYNVCGWTTGDASGGSGGFGGTPAQAGFDAGNMTDFVEIPGSRTAAILNVCTTSNVGTPGIWQFAVRDGSVICPGAGDPCDTGMVGACSLGLTACVGGGIQCVQVGTMSGERCDNIDNDCNGTVDDGSGLCPAGEVCASGSCVPPCFEGSCNSDETCDDVTGSCVETACIGMVCPAGARCVGGTCVDGCSGVVCPHGQQCFAGRCADMCDILTCGSGEVCQDGMCIPECPCHACAASETCAGDGRCISTGCDLTLCDPGFYCEAGACLDACDGASCPPGQFCTLGMCMDNPIIEVDAGPIGGPDGSVGPGVDGGGVGPGIDAGAGGGDAGRGRPNRPNAGCSCEVHTRPSTSGAWALVLGVLGLVVSRRIVSRRVVSGRRPS